MRILTWNIQWCRGVDGRVDPARIVREARRVADFDVLCLQEVAANFDTLKGSQGENQFALIAQALPGFMPIPGAAVDTPASDGSRQVFGNMILSRLPVAQVQRVQLPWPVDPGSKGMVRMLLEATVQAPFGPVRIMTTHLEYYSALQRSAQVEAIRARHAQACGHARLGGSLASSRGPFQQHPQTTQAVLTGDFNYRPEDALHARMQAPFDEAWPSLRDAWTQAHPGEPNAHTNGLYDRDQWPESFCCDFIYVSEDLLPRVRNVTVDALSRASDHQPVLLELD